MLNQFVKSRFLSGKKILLLAALSCFLIMQTKIVFAKCGASLEFTRASDLSTGYAIYGHDTTFYMAIGDTIFCVWSGTYGCTVAWERFDDSSQTFVLIQSSYKYNAAENGWYKVHANSCLCPFFYFHIAPDIFSRCKESGFCF